jgi:hypothetical protein
MNTIGIADGPRRQDRLDRPDGHDRGDPKANKVGRLTGKPVVLAVGPLECNGHIPAFDGARFAESVLKCGDINP